MPITTTDARPSRAPRKTHPMTPRLGVVLLPLFVAGCGLPPAVTIAAMAIDAISLAVNEKTVADYALSQIAQKDCSMWRGFTGDICIDEDSTVAVAAADGQPPAGGAASADLGAITTASGHIDDGSMDHVQPAATADRPAPRRERVPAAMVGPGLYYVIGSFSQWNNAQRLAARHGTLAPSVVTGKLDGRKLFRVVIGPYGPNEQKDMRALIRRSGIYDAWAVRMNSAEWSVARSTGTARNQVHAIA